jgi:hypothetical protein
MGPLHPRTVRGFLNPRYLAQKAIDTNGAPVWIPTTGTLIVAGEEATRAIEPDPEPTSDDGGSNGGSLRLTNGPQIEEGTDLTGLSEADMQAVANYRGQSPTQAGYADQLRSYKAQSEGTPVFGEGSYQKKPRRTKTLRDGTFRYLPPVEPKPVTPEQREAWLEQRSPDLP